MVHPNRLLARFTVRGDLQTSDGLVVLVRRFSEPSQRDRDGAEPIDKLRFACLMDCCFVVDPESLSRTDRPILVFGLWKQEAAHPEVGRCNVTSS